MTPPASPAAPVPDRSGLTPGIAHLGVGNFHRSHQAMYLDRLLRRGTAKDWGIVGIGLLPGDLRMQEVLRAQDFAYTLVELAGDGGRAATRIGSIVDMLHAAAEPEAVLELLASPRIRIVSLTITEGGYNTSDATGEFDVTEPTVRADVGAAHPRTVFGVIAAGLHRRRSRGVAPFTIASCDNIIGNGDTARRALVSFARLAYDDAFADWIDAEVAFPNSMVDRITPATGDTERALVRDAFGIDDAWPVVCEPFTQWVFEDRFPLGRPDWERAGAQPVDDVAPYELLKLRLLNGSHQAMAYAGLLRGHTYVHEATADPVVSELIERWMDEAAATLLPVEGIDIREYRARLRDRFANPYIRDTLGRLATNASDRVPAFVLAAARERARSGLPSPVAARIAAGWAALLASGRALPDRQPDLVEEATGDAASSPERFLGRRDWFGALGDDPAFAAEFARAYREYQASADAPPARGGHPVAG